MKLLLALGVLCALLLAIGGWFAPVPKAYVPPRSPLPELSGRLDAAQGDIARLQLQVATLTSQVHALQAQQPGLSGPEVRALIEQLLPAPPPTTCDPTAPCP